MSFLAYQISGAPTQYGGGMVMKIETGASSLQMTNDHVQQQQQQYAQQQQLIQIQQGRNVLIFNTAKKSTFFHFSFLSACFSMFTKVLSCFVYARLYEILYLQIPKMVHNMLCITNNNEVV